METENRTHIAQPEPKPVLADVADILAQYIDDYMVKVKPSLKAVDNGGNKQQLFDLLEYVISNVKKLEWRRFGERDLIATFNFGCYCIWQDHNGANSSNSFNGNFQQCEPVKHTSVNVAKEYCQKDFERILLENIISMR
jgi:hypothetical protein